MVVGTPSGVEVLQTGDELRRLVKAGKSVPTAARELRLAEEQARAWMKISEAIGPDAREQMGLEVLNELSSMQLRELAKLHDPDVMVKLAGKCRGDGLSASSLGVLVRQCVSTGSWEGDD